MIIGLYIGLAIVGILALIRGRMQISKSKVVVGVPARLLGVWALAPFPLALIVGMIYVGANADVTNEAAVQQFVQEHQGAFTAIEFVCAIFVGLTLFVTAALLAVSPREAGRRARRRGHEEYDDYEPDDRPRRRPRRDEYDDEDRPRQRRDDLDDRAR